MFSCIIQQILARVTNSWLYAYLQNVSRHQVAERDLLEHFVYLGENAGIEVAECFLEAAEQSFAELSEMPRMGKLQRFTDPRLTGMRKWRVRGFERYNIYYRPIEDGIEVFRVIHSARDIGKIFK